MIGRCLRSVPANAPTLTASPDANLDLHPLHTHGTGRGRRDQGQAPVGRRQQQVDPSRGLAALVWGGKEGRASAASHNRIGRKGSSMASALSGVEASRLSVIEVR